MSIVSTKPYLMRAIYEWCVDQGFTPYLAAVVDEHTRVPPGYAREGQIVLNVGGDATHQLQMGNDVVTFQARFNGVAHVLSIPVANVLAIYARENGQGMAFEAGGDAAAEDAGEAEEMGAPLPAEPDDTPPPPPRGSHLKRIK